MKIIDIHGSGGGGKGGGGGQTFREDENTLQTSQTVKSLYALGEGQIGGLVYGAKSIYLNNVALQNPDSSYNFGGKVAWDQRQGLPSQPYMAGFPSASNEVVVGVEVTTTTPRTQTTSAANIDAVRVTIGLPNGLYEQKTDQNALVGSSVQVAIDKKPTASTSWVTDRTVTIDGKTTSPYAESVRIERPSNATGTWDIRMRRITADTASATLKNNTFWNTYTEIQDVKLEYDNTAYVGVAINARDLGNQSVPTVSFEVFGLFVKVPSNYDPVARTYTGVWDGTFKMAWTDNPAWHLYDMLVNTRYGLGYRIGDARVDKYSFYAAAVYNDGLVPDGNGGQEPRFTCNVPIQVRDQALTVCQNLATNMHAKVVWMGNKVALIQDRPTSSTRLLTTANVFDGLFEYSSSTLQDRKTAALITWNNPTDNYLQKIELVDASSETGSWQTTLQNAQNRFGYNVDEQAAYGCTRQGQARRHGRWLLDSMLNLNEQVKFKMSLNGFDLQAGDVVTVSDPFYASQQLGGRVASGCTTTTIQLDRPIAITAGSTISLQMPNGIETQTITTTAGTVTSVTVGTAFSAAPTQYTDFIITTSISPRQFRIDKITQPDIGTVEVEALLYDPNKFARIESGVVNPAPVFASLGGQVPVAPTNLTFTENAVYVDNAITRSLYIGWIAPTSNNTVSYSVQYRMAGGSWVTVDAATTSLQINSGLTSGLVDVQVYAIGPTGLLSPALIGSHLIDVTEADGSTLLAPINLQIVGGGNTFTGQDIHFEVTNPSGNGTNAATIKDLVFEIYDPATGLLKDTHYIASSFPSGTTKEGVFDYAANVAVFGAPGSRSVQIKAYFRDTNNKRSVPVSSVFTNPAPAAPTGIVASPAVGTNFLNWTNSADADFRGTYIWASTTSGFSPSQATLIATVTGDSFVHGGLGNSQTWYYRIGSFDLFSQPKDGSGLNLSSEMARTTLSGVKVNEYQLTGITWTPNSPSANYVSWNGGQALQTLGANAGTSVAINAGNAHWLGGVLYIYYVQGNSTLQTSTNLSDAVGDTKMIVATYRGGTYLEHGDGRAYQDGGFIIAGTIGASQLVTGTAVITQGAQIANAVVGNAQIANASVDTLRIAGNAVTMPVAVELGSSVQITTLYNSPQQVMGLWIDSGGQPIFIEANLNICGFNLNPSVDGYTGVTQAMLYLDGSQVKYCYMSPAADNGGGGPNSRIIMTYYWPSPGTGSHLIEIRMGRWEGSIQGGQVYATRNGEYSVNSGNTLLALGLKR